MEPVRRNSHHPELVVDGTIKGAANSDIDVVIAFETVVPDDEIPEILGLFCTRTRSDAAGHFVDRYAPSAQMRRHLRGWVMCTVVVVPQVPGARGYSKTVRWQRPSSSELIAGLCGLLGSVSFEVGVVTG